MRIQIEGLKELLDSLQPLTQDEINLGLTRTSKIIEKSHKIGFTRRVSPDGEKWQSNPEWYALMKGNKKPLIGASKRKIQSGDYKGYSFSKMHYKRMKDSLESKISKKNTLTIGYKRSVKDRAILNQYGGESEMVLKSDTGREVAFNIEVMSRPHLGVSNNYIKHGGKTDPDHIRDIFYSIVEKKLRRKK